MNQNAVNFAKALYTLVAEERLEGEALQQLEVMQQAFDQEPNFVALLAAPNLSKQEKCIILDNCFRDKVHIYVLNFIKLLTEKGGIRYNRLPSALPEPIPTFITSFFPPPMNTAPSRATTLLSKRLNGCLLWVVSIQAVKNLILQVTLPPPSI